MRKFNIDGTSSSFFGANELQRTSLTDPDGNVTITFSNPIGQTVAVKKQLSGSSYAETYYIYDDLNQVKYILPPGAIRYLKANAWSVAGQFWNQHAYQFRYDRLGRATQKKNPGQSWTWYAYDKLNRVVLMQDGNLRPLNKWVFFKYDDRQRQIVSGFYKNTVRTTLPKIQHLLNTLYALPSDPYFETRNAGAADYTNLSFPTTNEDGTPLALLSVSYYDNYDFDGVAGDDYGYLNQSLPGEGSQASSSGRLTVKKTLKLNSTDWLYTSFFYDKYGRTIQSQSNNHLSLTNKDNITTNVYDFEKLIQTFTIHKVGTNQVKTLQKFSYDTKGRLTQIVHNIDNPFNTAFDKIVARYEYNELGQLVDKKLHYDGTNFLQSVDYRYTIQGKLKSINNALLSNDGISNDDDGDFFGMNLLYETADAGIGNTPQYDGKITAVKWKGPYSGTTAAGQKSYKYDYDQSDRLLAAKFKANDGTAWNTGLDAQNEEITYDYNGNIATMKRNQIKRDVTYNATYDRLDLTATSEAIDDLAYTYASPNQLSKVEDGISATIGLNDFKNGSTATTEYTYDSIGNVVSDLNKGITNIQYNEFGKPTQMTMTGGKTISYSYDAAGTKLSMSVNTPASQTDYVNGFVYTESVLDFFSSPEGRIKKNDASYEYQYAITDNQGNVRTMFTSVTPTVSEVTASFESDTDTDFDKYPTGMNLDGTQGRGGSGYALHLNGGPNGLVGLAKSYHVFPGDQLSISAYGKYLDTSGGPGSLTDFAGALISAFSPSLPGLGEPGMASAALGAYGGFEGVDDFANGSTDSSHPKAFVTILLFDNNFKFLSVHYDQVKTTSYSQITASTTVTEPGYAFVYISNENPAIEDVYFDDVIISYTPTRVLQHNDYYAFGMQSRESWVRLGSSNNFLYNQGSEINTSTALYDLPFRNYDATLGRFFQVDPDAMSYHDKTVYQYVSNNPVMMNDPTGSAQNTPGGLTVVEDFEEDNTSAYQKFLVWANNVGLSPAYNHYNDGLAWNHSGGTGVEYQNMTDTDLKAAAAKGSSRAKAELENRLGMALVYNQWVGDFVSAQYVLINSSENTNKKYLLAAAYAYHDWNASQGNPTKDKGGFLSAEDFYSFMLNQAKNNSVEVAGFELTRGKDTKYFVLPWENNTKSKSVIPIKNVGDYIPGYSLADVTGLFHTHPGSNPVGPKDMDFTNTYQIPIYSIGANGTAYGYFGVGTPSLIDLAAYFGR